MEPIKSNDDLNHLFDKRNMLHGRRAFLINMAKATGAAAMLSAPVSVMASSVSYTKQDYTVGQIIDLFIKEIPGGALENTVDTLKAGNRDLQVKGIVTTMFATLEVIQKAISLGANFIIAHEPTFYSHLDSTDWLQQDDVYQYKADLLKKHNIAIWRNHDYMHRYRPDGVLTALVNRLGWEQYGSPEAKSSFMLPATSLSALIQEVKGKLGITTVRYIGNLSQPVRKVLLLPGAAGGRSQIQTIGKIKPDVVFCGELSEWETAEYVRDARLKGQQLSLVVMGHNDSEDAGAVFMAQWLKEKVPGIKATHVNSGNPLSFL